MSSSLLGSSKRRNVSLELPLRCQFDLVLARDWNAILPLRNRRRLDAQGSGHFGLCAEIFDGLFVGHGDILGAPKPGVKECLMDFQLGLPT